MFLQYKQTNPWLTDYDNGDSCDEDLGLGHGALEDVDYGQGVRTALILWWGQELVRY